MAPVKNLTRQRYIAFLRRNQAASAEELARAMNVTPANARYHLTRLQADNLVQVVDVRLGGSRGRPVKIYGLSRISQGDNLPKLTDAILTDWLSLLEPSQLGDGIERIVQKIMEDSPSSSPTNFSRRLAIAMEHFNKMHYQARWEAHASGPRIIFESCPYASVISGHPELCLFDTRLLKEHLGGEVEHIAKREKGSRNIPVCIFSVME
jgi:predicted ArsR family transcriptional regulator